MPPRRRTSEPCAHARLQLEPSAYAAEAGFEWATPACRQAAASENDGRKRSRVRATALAEADTVEDAEALRAAFPGPLVLPWDELGWDPECTKQSFREWRQGGHRNWPTPARKTIYVAELVEIDDEVGFIVDWARPCYSDETGATVDSSSEVLCPIQVQDLVDYLAAYYHGFCVKTLPDRLQFKPHGASSKPLSRPKTEAGTVKAGAQRVAPETALIGLTTKGIAPRRRVHARAAPDGAFPAQLNLDDLLDTAIEELPRDAYAMILLTAHDLYEDPDDDFCCGRAYGGSRVCVVSTARYNPLLDNSVPRLDATHAWPAAHCRAYVDAACSADGIAKGTRALPAGPSSPLKVAVKSMAAVEANGDESRRGLWFGRVARTVAHELGHCLGLAHCVYYACLMQATAGLAEDYRQPPYLCPVCLAKITHAAVEARGDRNSSDAVRALYVKERYEALSLVCARWPHVAMLVAYEAWLRGRLKMLGYE